MPIEVFEEVVGGFGNDDAAWEEGVVGFGPTKTAAEVAEKKATNGVRGKHGMLVAPATKKVTSQTPPLLPQSSAKSVSTSARADGIALATDTLQSASKSFTPPASPGFGGPLTGDDQKDSWMHVAAAAVRWHLKCFRLLRLLQWLIYIRSIITSRLRPFSLPFIAFHKVNSHLPPWRTFRTVYLR